MAKKDIVQLPSIGRIVHYLIADRSVAAIIVDVYDATTVALRLLLPPSLNTLTDSLVESAFEGESEGCWRWPPFVQGKAVEKEPDDPKAGASV